MPALSEWYRFLDSFSFFSYSINEASFGWCNLEADKLKKAPTLSVSHSSALVKHM